MSGNCAAVTAGGRWYLCGRPVDMSDAGFSSCLRVCLLFLLALLTPTLSFSTVLRCPVVAQQ